MKSSIVFTFCVSFVVTLLTNDASSTDARGNVQSPFNEERFTGMDEVQSPPPPPSRVPGGFTNQGNPNGMNGPSFLTNQFAGEPATQMNGNPYTSMMNTPAMLQQQQQQQQPPQQQMYPPPMDSFETPQSMQSPNAYVSGNSPMMTNQPMNPQMPPPINSLPVNAYQPSTPTQNQMRGGDLLPYNIAANQQSTYPLATNEPPQGPFARVMASSPRQPITQAHSLYAANQQQQRTLLPRPSINQYSNFPPQPAPATSVTRSSINNSNRPPQLNPQQDEIEGREEGVDD